MDLCRTFGSRGNPISNEIELTFTVEKGDGIFPTGKTITFSPERKTCWMDLLQSNFEAGMAVKM